MGLGVEGVVCAFRTSPHPENSVSYLCGVLCPYGQWEKGISFPVEHVGGTPGSALMGWLGSEGLGSGVVAT